MLLQNYVSEGSKDKLIPERRQKKSDRQGDDEREIPYSKLDPIPYTEFMENNEEGMDNYMEETDDEIKVRRQISD